MATLAGIRASPGFLPEPDSRCQSNSGYGLGGGFTGNQYLVPLIGGSSGGGAAGTNDNGGAGGGAILIASSASISGSGSISVRGGNRSGYSGGGSGGAIRLVAPSVTISGALITAGDAGGCGPGSGSIHGVLRVEAFNAATTTYNLPVGSFYRATPNGLYLTPLLNPSLRVVSVGGVPVATSPTGTFTVPDVTVNSSAPLPVAIEASNVPIGTIVTLTIFTENAPDQIIQSTPLAGSVALSTASAAVTLPTGFSKGFLRATFTQP